MKHRYSFNLLLLLLIVGCSGNDYSPVDVEFAKSVKSGTPIAEIKAALGEPHPPTSLQQKRLDELVARMREPIRSNARQDQPLAWGNDSAFLAVIVNDQGIAWAVSWKSGSPRGSD